MKFTSMQQALAAGAIGAVAATPSMADNAVTSTTAELVLYVVNTYTGSAYSRGLGRINGVLSYLQVAGTGINGVVSIAGSAYTGTLTSMGDTATLTAAQTAAMAISGATTGYGSQPNIRVNFSLPPVMPDANLIKWLSANQGGDIRWSVQGGYALGNGSSASRRFVTTSVNNYDNGVNVTNGNLGMSGVTEINVWSNINSVVAGDNSVNPSLSTLDGTSITNSTYLTYSGPAAGSYDTAANWFTSQTNPANYITPLCSIGQSCNLYMVVSGNINSSASGRVFVYTMNDAVLNSAGFLKSIGHK